jgi:tetratricopeptide (TPR) repeat protein
VPRPDLGRHRAFERGRRQGRPGRTGPGQGCAKAAAGRALKLNDKALAGSAYTSLATLYAKVPGWPIGFGDKAKAEEYFKKALAINPTALTRTFSTANI